ncbi:hypothetical protein QBC44DRAFT_311620 [Cladorrhinum sp. PSN332]|nr:hypothetical protein QBC44DRAFT_311620 [Cladorrhinum sp. PSN332]
MAEHPSTPKSSFYGANPTVKDPHDFNWPALPLGTKVILHPLRLRLESLGDSYILSPLQVPAENYFVYTLFPEAQAILEDLAFAEHDGPSPTGKRVVMVYGTKLNPKPSKPGMMMKFWKNLKQNEQVNALVLDLHEPTGSPKREIARGLEEAKRRIEESGFLKKELFDGTQVEFKVFLRAPGDSMVFAVYQEGGGAAVDYGRLGSG